MATYVVATIKSWNLEQFEKLCSEDTKNNWVLINNKDDLTYEHLQELQPRYIFFPHWSWIIPRTIFSDFECIVFHMADLPYGRGGSPLQNLIVRGHNETKLSALRVVAGLDAGDVYMKEPLTLDGTAEEILKRASVLTFAMIRKIVATEPTPVAQTGQVVEFKRRTPSEGNIAALTNLKEIFDHIRMLDGEGYPPAFLETETLRCEFKEAALGPDGVTAKVTITLKK